MMRENVPAWETRVCRLEAKLHEKVPPGLIREGDFPTNTIVYRDMYSRTPHIHR